MQRERRERERERERREREKVASHLSDQPSRGITRRGPKLFNFAGGKTQGNKLWWWRDRGHTLYDKGAWNSHTCSKKHHMLQSPL